MQTPEFRKLEFEMTEDGICILTFNIPEKRNALNADCHEDLHTFVDFLENEPTARVGIVTGAGPKSFTSGNDVSGFDNSEGNKWFPANRLKEAIDRFETCPKPIIAAINGYCIGGGVEMAAGCDLRICSDNAWFRMPEVGLGIIPGAGGIQRLVRTCGAAFAKEMVLTTRKLTAQEAYERGFVMKVVPQEELMDEALAVARMIVAQAPLAVSLAKLSCNLVPDTPRAAAYALELWGQAVLINTDDAAEGPKAFMEKRKPNFTGQ